MVPAGGGRVPDCGELLALARPRRPLSTYATTERDLMTDNVVVNSVSPPGRISMMNLCWGFGLQLKGANQAKRAISFEGTTFYNRALGGSQN